MAERTEVGARSWERTEIVAAVAGLFLLWRGLFGRGGAFGLLAGAYVLRRTLRARAAARSRRRGVEVVEVKSPAELETGAASATPRPTSRADGGGDDGRAGPGSRS